MRFLIYLLPLLPFIIYFIYFAQKNRQLKKDEILVGLKNGPYVQLTFIGLIILIVLILLFTLLDIESNGENYTPARYENGVLIPSKME